MNNKFVKRIVCAVQNVVVKNTYPAFDYDSKPVNVWKVLPGYDEIELAIKAQFDDAGEISDGFHTFNELYHHRATLFSVICNIFYDRAWKSKKHSDGTMYDGMFIVGINTPNGQATYHYDIDPYWDMFDVPEVELAQKWDGHTSDDAIERIVSLRCETKVSVVFDKDYTKALDILDQFEFFGGRSGRELWQDKPTDIQNADIEKYKENVTFLVNFIKRQKAENSNLLSVLTSLQKDLTSAKAEIERLKKANEMFTDIGKMYSEIKAEAIKSFAYKITEKASIIEVNGFFHKYVVSQDDIDSLVKEMVGDNNE